MHRRLLAILFLLPIGCGTDDGARQAMQTVDELQAALLAGDARGCRALVTEDSAAALADFPWHRLAGKRPLTVTGAERADSFYRVRVIDPNAGDRPGEFIVVREYGRVVVDLVATAGLTAEFSERPGTGNDFVPRELTPADEDRIRKQQLATPR